MMPLVMANANVLWLLITLLLLVKIHVLNRQVDKSLDDKKFNRYKAFQVQNNIKKEVQTETNKTTPSPESTKTTRTVIKKCEFENELRNMMYRRV